MDPITVLLATFGTAFIGILAATVGLVGYHVLRRKPAAPVKPPTDAKLEARLAAVEVKVEALPSLWEEERSRAERAHAAARAARSSAQKKLDELEALQDGDDEDAEVQWDDAGGGPGGGLPAVPEGMASDGDDDLRSRAAASGWSPLLKLG